MSFPHSISACFRFQLGTNDIERLSLQLWNLLLRKPNVTMFCWCSEDLQQRLAALEQERAEFLRLKQQLEAEFNQKRAKFKELYLSKEGMDPGTVCDHCSATLSCDRRGPQIDLVVGRLLCSRHVK